MTNVHNVDSTLISTLKNAELQELATDIADSAFEAVFSDDLRSIPIFGYCSDPI